MSSWSSKLIILVILSSALFRSDNHLCLADAGGGLGVGWGAGGNSAGSHSSLSEPPPQLPQEKKFKTAFELLERTQAEGLAFQFKKFCHYKRPTNLTVVWPEAGSRDVVMGLASGYNLGQVVAFIVSLRKSGFQGALLLGVDGSAKSKQMLELFEKHSVTAINLSGMRLKEFAQVCRYSAYHDWVDQLTFPESRILVSDVRDVYFQENPFTATGPPLGRGIGAAELLVFEEARGDHDHINLFSQKLNRRWITEAYSGDPLGLRGYSKFWVLCSGTTMGTRKGMLEYMTRMQAEAMLCRQRHPTPFKRGRVMVDVCIGGADQGFHNVLFYRGQLPGAQSVPNGQGQVYTVGIFPKFHLKLDQDAEGFVVNPQGKKVSVIHQSDTTPSVNLFVFKKYLENEIPKSQFINSMTKGARYSVKG